MQRAELERMPLDPTNGAATAAADVDPHASFDPDAEALRLAMRVVAQARVARSFARIAAGVVQETARQASTVLRAYAGVALANVATAPAEGAATEAARVPHATVPLGRIARAAAEAAGEVGVAELARVLGALEAMTAPRPAGAPPPSSQTTGDDDEAAPSSGSPPTMPSPSQQVGGGGGAVPVTRVHAPHGDAA